MATATVWKSKPAEMDAPVSNRGHIDFPAEAAGQSLVVSRIEWNDQRIEIHSQTLFGWDAATSADDRRRLRLLLERLFRSNAVSRAEIDRNFHRLVIHLAEGFHATPFVLSQVSQAFAGELDTLHTGSEAIILWDEAPTGSFTLGREGRLLTTWHVLEDAPDRIILKQPSLRHEHRLAEQLQPMLEEMPGVGRFTIDEERGLLSLKAVPGQILDRQLIVQALEQLTTNSASLALQTSYPKAKMVLPLVSLGLAATAQWANPVVWPAAAALIIFLNWKIMVRSLRDLGKGELGLPLLTTLIVVGTLAGGALTASALFTVLSRYWQNQYSRMLSHARREWLGQLALPGGSYQLVKPNNQLETRPSCMIKADDVIELTASEAVPADGHLIEGEAEVEYPFGEVHLGASGTDFPNRIYTGGRLKSGHIRLKVDRVGGDTRLARIREELFLACGTNRGDSALNTIGQKFGEKTVLPTLALAGLGLAAGGVGTAVAVMRPDYATGVGMGQSLEMLRLSGDALHDGFLIRDAQTLLQADQVQLWLVEKPNDASPEFLPAVPGQMVAEIVGPSRIDLVHQGQRLTLQGIPPIRNDVDRVRLFQLLRQRGIHQIGWVGDAERFPNAARAANLTLSTNSSLDATTNPAAAIWLADIIRPDWNKLLCLVQSQHAEQSLIRGMILAPNALAVLGALTMGFTSMASVIISSMGTWLVHERTRKKSSSQRSITREQPSRA